jgi:phosphatidylglycerophosphatase A
MRGGRFHASDRLRGRTGTVRSDNIVKVALATAGGLGLSPVLPGTAGALAGVAIYLSLGAVSSGIWLTTWLFFVLVGVAALNHVLTPWAQAFWGHPDPSAFVLDEVAGFLVVPLLAPAAPSLVIGTLGFAAFRILDTVKIPPARQIDRKMPGSWGILLDDLVSGAYAALLVNGFEYWRVTVGVAR